MINSKVIDALESVFPEYEVTAVNTSCEQSMQAIKIEYCLVKTPVGCKKPVNKRGNQWKRQIRKMSALFQKR